MTFGPENIGSLGISVGVKIPKQVTDFIKTVPDIRAEAKGTVKKAEAQVSRITAVGESAIVAAQAIAVVAVFGIIIASLLAREKKK